jgi:uncharacterized protein
MNTLARAGLLPATPETPAEPTVPWWRLPIVWMVIGGPAVVVVASFVTLTLAIQNPDPVLARPAAKNKAEQPAVQGRNHAATPEQR